MQKGTNPIRTSTKGWSTFASWTPYVIEAKNVALHVAYKSLQLQETPQIYNLHLVNFLSFKKIFANKAFLLRIL